MSDYRFERLLQTPCTIVTRTQTGTDPYGGPEYAETESETTCFVEQQSHGERGVDEIDVERWRLFLRPDETILPKDRVEVLGGSYEVDGAAWPVVDARTGAAHHLEASMRRAQ